ncbi:hypothetical protein D3C81_1538210 [compost metagenome]
MLQFVSRAGHRPQIGVELADDGLALEIKADGQVEVVAGNLHGLVDQCRQVAGGQLAIAAPTEAEHVGDNLGCARSGLLDAIEQLRDFAAFQVAVDDRQVDAQFVGLLLILRQLWRQAPANVLHVVQDRAQWVVDFMSHASGQAPD